MQDRFKELLTEYKAIAERFRNKDITDAEAIEAMGVVPLVYAKPGQQQYTSTRWPIAPALVIGAQSEKIYAFIKQFASATFDF